MHFARRRVFKAPPLSLYLLLEYPLLFLEYAWVGRWPLVGSGKAVPVIVYERQPEGDRSGGKVHCLNLQHLAFLELADQFGRGLIVGHAAIGKAREKRCAQGRVVIDDEAGTVLHLQRARQRDAEKLLRLAFRLDQRRRDNRPASVRASLPVKHTSRVSTPLPLPQNFCHGE